MNRLYRTMIKAYDVLRGKALRRTTSRTIPSFRVGPSDFYNQELGVGTMVEQDMERLVTREMERTLGVPEGELQGVDQEAIINYWNKRKDEVQKT